MVKYEIRVCEFDGWDYQFPITEPERIKELGKIETNNREISTIDDWVDVNIPYKLKEGYLSWSPTDEFILNMRPNSAVDDDKNAYVGRFSYNPSTKEFLPSKISTSHASSIKQFGSSIYNKYIRGIYVRDKETILLRPYYDPMDEDGKFNPHKHYDRELDKEKTWATIEMLAKNGLQKNHKIITKVNNDFVKEFIGLFI